MNTRYGRSSKEESDEKKTRKSQYKRRVGLLLLRELLILTLSNIEYFEASEFFRKLISVGEFIENHQNQVAPKNRWWFYGKRPTQSYSAILFKNGAGKSFAGKITLSVHVKFSAIIVDLRFLQVSRRTLVAAPTVNYEGISLRQNHNIVIDIYELYF